MTQKLLFLLSLCFLLGLQIQAQSKPTMLARSDITVNPKLPTVFLSVEKSRTETRSEVWIKLVNNTIWTIRFLGEQPGVSTKLLELSNGTKVMGLQDGSISYPQYQLEPTTTIGNVRKPSWGDLGNPSFLPSNSCTLFKVPSQYVRGGMLYLEYKYEWEIIGSAGQESYSPTHRVHLQKLEPMGEGQCDRK